MSDFADGSVCLLVFGENKEQELKNRNNLYCSVLYRKMNDWNELWR